MNEKLTTLEKYLQARMVDFKNKNNNDAWYALTDVWLLLQEAKKRGLDIVNE